MSSPSLRWQIVVREPAPEVLRHMWHDLPGSCSCSCEWQLGDGDRDMLLAVSATNRYDATGVVAYLLAMDQSFSFRVDGPYGGSSDADFEPCRGTGSEDPAP